VDEEELKCWLSLSRRRLCMMRYETHSDILAVARVTVPAMDKGFLHGLEHVVVVLQVAVLRLPNVYAWYSSCELRAA
jgi:hypothetical protein